MSKGKKDIHHPHPPSFLPQRPSGRPPLPVPALSSAVALAPATATCTYLAIHLYLPCHRHLHLLFICHTCSQELLNTSHQRSTFFKPLQRPYTNDLRYDHASLERFVKLKRQFIAQTDSTSSTSFQADLHVNFLTTTHSFKSYFLTVVPEALHERSALWQCVPEAAGGLNRFLPTRDLIR